MVRNVRRCDAVERPTSIYERIVVRGAAFVSVRLTPEAYSLDLAVALPERVQPGKEWVHGGPTGFEREGTHLGFRFIAVEGAEEWEAGCLLSA